MERNPFDMVDTMKVKNGIQIDGMHKMDNGDCDLVDPSSYCDTNEESIELENRNFKIFKIKSRTQLCCLTIVVGKER